MMFACAGVCACVYGGQRMTALDVILRHEFCFFLKSESIIGLECTHQLG